MQRREITYDSEGRITQTKVYRQPSVAISVAITHSSGSVTLPTTGAGPVTFSASGSSVEETTANLVQTVNASSTHAAIRDGRNSCRIREIATGSVSGVPSASSWELTVLDYGGPEALEQIVDILSYDGDSNPTLVRRRNLWD